MPIIDSSIVKIGEHAKASKDEHKDKGLSGLFHKAENKVSHLGNKIVDDAKHAVNTVDNKIAGVEKGVAKKVSDIKKDVEGDIKSAGSAIKTAASKIPGAVKAGAKDLEAAALEAGKAISELEADVLPSANKILMETGLVIAGVAVIGIVALKFL